jgi:hypothetical protein
MMSRAMLAALAPRMDDLFRGGNGVSLIWLDVPLTVFGMLGLAFWGWIRFRQRRLLPSLRRAHSWSAVGMTVALGLSLTALAVAAVDVGEAEWENARRPYDSDAVDYVLPAMPRLPVGLTAPDFRLPRLNGEGTVQLSDLREHKPVVLLFGSFG